MCGIKRWFYQNKKLAAVRLISSIIEPNKEHIKGMTFIQLNLNQLTGLEDGHVTILCDYKFEAFFLANVEGKLS